jgi:hypothetical protein
MALRRPTPDGFDEGLAVLVSLEHERKELQRRIDDAVIQLTVEMRGPTSVIAERLKITCAAVSARRLGALRRREQRSQAT